MRHDQRKHEQDEHHDGELEREAVEGWALDPEEGDHPSQGG